MKANTAWNQIHDESHLRTKNTYKHIYIQNKNTCNHPNQEHIKIHNYVRKFRAINCGRIKIKWLWCYSGCRSDDNVVVAAVGIMSLELQGLLVCSSLVGSQSSSFFSLSFPLLYPIFWIVGYHQASNWGITTLWQRRWHCVIVM